MLDSAHVAIDAKENFLQSQGTNPSALM